VTGASLQYGYVPATTAYGLMNSATSNNGWTVEAIISTTSTTEQYIFGPRNDADNQGMAFGIKNGQMSTWARGATAGIGAGANPRLATTGPTVEQYTWNHLAWVKLPTDAANIYMYLNGVSCGSVACGTNATTTQSWTNFVIGTLTGWTGFNFKGRIGGVRVSNVALYTTAFTPPDCLMPLSSSTFCLGPNRTDLVTGLVLSSVTTAGSVEGVTEIADGKIYEL